MSRSCVIFLSVVSVLMDPVVRNADAACYKSVVRSASTTTCQCLNNDCVRATADAVNEFRRCVLVIPGESGNTVCNSADSVVGTRKTCVAEVDQAAVALAGVGMTGCTTGFATCALLAAPGGLAELACVAAFLFCVAGAGGAAVADCTVRVCSTDHDSEQDNTRPVSTSLAGDACEGEEES